MLKHKYIQQLLEQMNQLVPESEGSKRNRTSYQVVATDYVNWCVDSVLKYQIYHTSKNKFNLGKNNPLLNYVSLKTLHSREHRIPGQRQTWNKWITENAASLIRVVAPGNNINQMLSGVALQNCDLLDIITMATESPGELFDRHYGPHLHSELEFDWVPIDVPNLQRYIKSTREHVLQQQPYSKEYRKFMRYLFSAETILALTLETKNRFAEQMPAIRDHYLIQFRASNSNFGRINYVGINLQNISRVVRVAALGQCYEYDINAGVFAAYAHWTDAECLDLDSFAFYLDNKQFIRQTLVSECLINTRTNQEHKLDIIKRAINALGFGATSSSGYMKRTPGKPPQWVNNALADIILSKADRDLFIKHDFVKAIQSDVKALTKHCVSLADPELLKQRWLRGDNAKGECAGNFSGKKLMAYLYQQHETQVMDAVLNSQPDVVVALRVHDAVYTLSKLDVEAAELDAQAINPYITFSSERKAAWFNKLDAEQEQQQIAAHKQHLQQEEQLARTYAARTVETSPPPVKIDYAERNQQIILGTQLLQDVQQGLLTEADIQQDAEMWSSYQYVKNTNAPQLLHSITVDKQMETRWTELRERQNAVDNGYYTV